MEGQVGTQGSAPGFIPVQLEMILFVIVDLVVVKSFKVACGVELDPGYVVPAVGAEVRINPYGRQSGCIKSIPRLVGDFVAPEKQGLDQPPLIPVGPLQKIGIEIRRSPVDIPVGSDAGEAA